MPASTISSTLSWGVYLASASCLQALLLPFSSAVARESQAAAQRSEIEGATQVLNGLEPGVSVHFVLGAAGGGAVLLLSGHTVALDSAGGRLTESCRWNLPDAAVSPGVPYTLSLSG